MYSVKEIFLTLQGEGAQVGRTAVFLRFAGCNLWTGHEKDREKAVCKFCDTQFVGTDGTGGGKYDAVPLALKVADVWCSGTTTGLAGTRQYIVCTGGEPGLQLDKKLVDAFHEFGFEVAIETNGTVDLSGRGIDWICVSPKAGAELKQLCGDELKLVFPQLENDPRQFKNLDFKHFFLSPKNDPHRGLDQENTKATIEYCMQHPRWRLNLQTHKITGIR